LPLAGTGAFPAWPDELTLQQGASTLL